MTDKNEDFDSKGTYSFPMDGRERWAEEMQEYGYVEMPGYIGTTGIPEAMRPEVIAHAYCCANCPYMVKASSRDGAGLNKTQSLTGYWCKKFNFPDRPNGYCDGWAPKS